MESFRLTCWVDDHAFPDLGWNLKNHVIDQSFGGLWENHSFTFPWKNSARTKFGEMQWSFSFGLLGEYQRKTSDTKNDVVNFD